VPLQNLCQPLIFTRQAEVAVPQLVIVGDRRRPLPKALRFLSIPARFMPRAHGSRPRRPRYSLTAGCDTPERARHDPQDRQPDQKPDRIERLGVPAMRGEPAGMKGNGCADPDMRRDAEAGTDPERYNSALHSCYFWLPLRPRFLNGLGLYQRLSTSEKPIPTILIEAYPDDGVRERALSAGVIGYLSKPSEDHDLLACVRSALMDIRGGGR
jgi:hypothetical protein